jgi:hypothetical protein
LGSFLVDLEASIKRFPNATMTRLVQAAHAWCGIKKGRCLMAAPFLFSPVFMGGPNKSGHDERGVQP